MYQSHSEVLNMAVWAWTSLEQQSLPDKGISINWFSFFWDFQNYVLLGLYTEIPGQQSSAFITGTATACCLPTACASFTLHVRTPLWTEALTCPLNNYTLPLLLLKSDILKSVISKYKSLVTLTGKLLKEGRHSCTYLFSFSFLSSPSCCLE